MSPLETVSLGDRGHIHAMNLKRTSLLCFFLLSGIFSPPVFSAPMSSPPAKAFSSHPSSDLPDLTLVFMPLHYAKPSAFRKDVDTLFAELKKEPPFNKFDRLRIYLLEGSSSDEEFFQKTEAFPFLELKRDFLDQLSLMLGGPYKLIVLDQKGSTAGAQLSDLSHVSVIILGRKVSSGNSGFSCAFLHEMGHSLGLREEGTFSSEPVVPGPPNCAIDRATAEKWWGDMVPQDNRVGYFEFEAGGKKFIKPTRHSVMSNSARFGSYGPVNERYLRTILDSPKQS